MESTNLPRRILENFVLLWFDPCIDGSNENYQTSLNRLRRVIHPINTFTDADRCIDFLTEIEVQKAFMIVADTLGQNFIELIHDIPHLDTIYIFCGNTANHGQWSKVKGICSDINLICELLKRTSQQCDQNLISISFAPISTTTLKRDLDQLDQSFMYTQLLKETLLEIDDNPIGDFIAYCRGQYHDNPAELKKVDKFEEEYRREAAIWWYTSEYFIYSIVNYALRTLDVDIILKMAFFIRDLHRHIEQLHVEHSSKDQAPFTVYRGQGLSKIDFEKMMQTIGGLMSFNNFLSTSRSRDVSLLLAESNCHNPNLIGILFEITVDRSLPLAPFAMVDDISQFSSEREVLFSMHTIFRIGEIKSIDKDNRLWQVKLTLTRDKDPQLTALTVTIQAQIMGTGGSQSTAQYRLGKLLLKLGEFSKAKQLFITLLDRESDESVIVSLCHNLGYGRQNVGEYEEALAFYQKALAIHQKSSTPNVIDMSSHYNNIGLVYHQMGEHLKGLSFLEEALRIRQKNLHQFHPVLAVSYKNIATVYNALGEFSKALLFFEKALEIGQKVLPPNHPDLASSYNGISTLYSSMGEYPKALISSEKAIEIKEKSLPANHPGFADAYNNIGTLYKDMGENSKALVFVGKALQIFEKSMPSNHPLLATINDNIGSLYCDKEEYSKAFAFHEKALEIKQKAYPPEHYELALSYNNIGAMYLKLKEYFKALFFFEKALGINQRTFPSNRSHLAVSYHIIGEVYSYMKEYLKELFYYEKAMEIKQKILPASHPDLAMTYNNVGIIYYCTKEYLKALFYYEKALEIYKQTLPSNHPHLATINSNIGKIYLNMNQHKKALPYHEKALEICQKILPLNHPDLVYLYDNCGESYYGTGNVRWAIKLFEKSLKILQQRFPASHSDIIEHRKIIDALRKKM